ncbi:diaminopimelate decarboxylase [Salibacterium salarium]|uniref:Diaminopimelate decarboxylase n=1 Tax=Salibacterium salarium TaxID=284579 RepID=A0A428MV49_9BACI|nr:diaminopimelate decarboxylase [Salibacterium salarium]RSL29994.1 diaminopimelate decarboxylase [Salibacterium salarium]
MKPVVRENAEQQENTNPLVNYQKLRQLEEKHGTSFYIMDASKLRRNYRKIERAFKSRYENFIIGYSYKTNYLPVLCKELSKAGAYAEVVSRLEYDLAVKIGEDPKRIIFNGPFKTQDDIEHALYHGSLLNIDSLYEIDVIKQYCLKNKKKQYKVGLRLNFDVSEDGRSALQEGYEKSRFGLCVQNGVLERTLDELAAIPNIEVAGLHGHFSTKSRSVHAYRQITQKLCRIAKEHITHTLEYIDIGGGIYGELPATFHRETPSFDDYAEAVCAIMNREFEFFEKKPNLILEPGISMVANTFVFFAKVMDVKKVADKKIVLVDGSIHHVKPTMHKNNLPMNIIRKSEQHEEGDETLFDVVGYTCMEKDYLADELKRPLPETGDYIMFENVGAYSIVFHPPFIKERPAIVAVDHETIFTARRKETFKEFFNEDLYVF